MPIPLDEVRKYLRYEPEGRLVWRQPPKWQHYIKGDDAGWISAEGVRVLRWPGGGGMVYAHRLVWYMHTGEWPGLRRLRFKDGNKLNIRFENLEPAARSKRGNAPSRGGAGVSGC